MVCPIMGAELTWNGTDYWKAKSTTGRSGESCQKVSRSIVFWGLQAGGQEGIIPGIRFSRPFAPCFARLADCIRTASIELMCEAITFCSGPHKLHIRIPAAGIPRTLQ